MEDLGPPIGYPALAEGVAVYDRGGTDVGTVAHVLADEGPDIFHGILIRTGSSGSHLFADRDQVAGLYERGVRLAVDAGALRAPSADPVAAESDRGPADQAGTGLRRAWEWLSGH